MTAAAKVGLFALVALLIAGFFILRIEDIDLGSRGKTKRVEVMFDSAAGLNRKADVRVAGVPVGKVEDIKLDKDGRARVTLEVGKDVQLHQGSSAEIVNLGLLGEKYVELKAGNPAAPLIAQKGGMVVLPGTQAASIDDVTSQVSEIAKDVKAITSSLRAAMGGPQGEQRVDEIVANVHEVTARLRLLLAVNQGNINASAENIRRITDELRVEIPKIAASIDRVVNSFGRTSETLAGTVGENRGDVRVIVDNLKDLSRDLKTTTDNLNDITGKVRSGEGTVGKLFYSDEAHKRLTGALESVEGGVGELRNVLGRVGKIELDLGIKADYLAGMNEDPVVDFGGNSRKGLTVKLKPNPALNRFYYGEVMEDPRGTKKEKVIQTTTINAAGQSSTITTRETKFESDLAISAQAGWQYDDLALRVGLFDSLGGFAADYAMNDRTVVTGEAFDFGKGRDDLPHLRLYGQYFFRKEKTNAPALFVTSGIDNPLNDTAFMIGGGIRWRDDDIKYLLGSLPIP